jgi:hypothetical protein
VREIQTQARLQPTVEALAQALVELAEVPPEQRDQLLDVLGKLWSLTPRYELRGRTPAEAARAELR